MGVVAYLQVEAYPQVVVALRLQEEVVYLQVVVPLRLQGEVAA